MCAPGVEGQGQLITWQRDMEDFSLQPLWVILSPINLIAIVKV